MMADPQFFHFTQADRERIIEALTKAVKTGTGILRISAPSDSDAWLENVDNETTMHLCGWDEGDPAGDQTVYYTSTPKWEPDDFHDRARTAPNSAMAAIIGWWTRAIIAEWLEKQNVGEWKDLMYGVDPDAEARQHAIRLGWPPECIGVMRGMRIITTEQLARMFPVAPRPKFNFDEELHAAADHNAKMQERAHIKRREAATKRGQQASLTKLRRKKGGY